MKTKKLNINRSFRQLFVRRKYRDLLFQRVFRDKKDLLDLYNTLNGTDYTNTEELEITTLEDAIYLSMKNDVSFMISSTLKLSSAYMREGHLTQENREPALECTARMLNINYGHNKAILDSCIRLHDYAYFIDRVNQNISQGMRLREAINEAIDHCMEQEILYDILSKQRAEVTNMLLTEYDKKLHDKTLRREGYEEAVVEYEKLMVLERAEGKQEGKQEGKLEEKATKICKKLQKNKTLEQIADELEEEISKIKPLYDIAVTEAPEYDVHRIVQRYLEKYGLEQPEGEK